MKTKIPPPLVMIFFGICILLSKRVFPTIDFGIDYGAFTYFGFIFYILSACLIVTSINAFRKKQTTVNPLKPDSASSLVTSGVFKITRNPMYLAMLLVLVGLTFQQNAPGGILCAVLFIIYITKFQIVPEEEAMSKLFGDMFDDYKNKVRRWI